MTYRCGDSAPPRAPDVAPKTRGVEVAPGVFVADVSTVLALAEFDGRVLGYDEPRPMVTLTFANGAAMAVDGTAAEVAAKLWPVEDEGAGKVAKLKGFTIEEWRDDAYRFHDKWTSALGDAQQERMRLRDEVGALREAFLADSASVNSDLWHAVREYLEAQP